jgi:CRISPR-associated protein Cas2
MRNAYIVSYDIANPKRLRRVFKTMCGFGDHIQFSVFRCEFTAMELVRMKGVLAEIINQKADQVLIFDLGPIDGRADDSVDWIGLPLAPKERTALIA